MKVIDGVSYRTKEDLRDAFVGLERYRPGDPSVRNLFIRLTSGTTSGTPTMLVVSFGKRSDGPSKHVAELYAKPFLFLSSRNSLALPHLQRFMDSEEDPSRILILGNREMEHPRVASILAEFSPRHVFSFVSLFQSLAEKLAGRGEVGALKSVEWSMLSGEMLSETARGKLTALLPQNRIDMRYGFSEAGGGVGASCVELRGRHRETHGTAYHPLIPIRIVNPDENGVGEIAIRTAELGDYLTGDAGRLFREACACGEEETLVVSGRMRFDIIHCVGATFHAALVEKVFERFRDYVEDYHLEIREAAIEGKTLGSIVFSIVPTPVLRGREDGEAFITAGILQNLQLTKTRTLGDLVQSGIFLPPVISFVPSLSAPGKKVRMRKVD